jgi:2-methylcitrate dehydratase PrpD
VHAFGIAGSFASGISEFCESGGMVKRLHAGRPAEGGVLAAYLARDGVTGPTTVLEGKYGYLKCFSDSPEPEQLTAGLGERFMIDEITVKPYSCCSDIHATIDALLEIKEKHGIEAGEVSHVLVESTTKVAEQNAGDGTTSMMAAQYSVRTAAAITLMMDIRDPRVYSDETLANPDLKILQDKVEVRANDEFDAIYARILGARVTVTAKDGRTFTATVKGARGSIQRPFSQADVEDKFLRLCRGILDDGKPERLADIVAVLDQGASLDELGNQLRGPFRAADASAKPQMAGAEV